MKLEHGSISLERLNKRIWLRVGDVHGVTVEIEVNPHEIHWIIDACWHAIRESND